MVSSILSVVVAVVGVGFLILAHEFGHFIVAKATGMRVEEFSLGFGRYLWSRRVGETVYGISLVPLGGYVRVTGMHAEEFEERVKAAKESRDAKLRDPESRMTGRSAISDEEIAATPLERRYYAHPVWQRVVFIVAGVTMNVVVAFFLLFFVGLQGYFEPTTVVDRVEAGSAAADAGVLVGDRFVSIGADTTDEWFSVQQAILSRAGERVDIVVDRAGTHVTLSAEIGLREDGTGVLGVGPVGEKVDPGVLESLAFARDRTGELFAITFSGIGMMFKGEVPVTGSDGLAGPVGIVSISSEAFRSGYFLSLLAFISVQLAILNMLPLLPLDGGHVLFSLIEKGLGRAVSLRTFERVSAVGISLFLLLLIVATGNDIGRLFGGSLGF
ncbi:MAG: M50 family metallopeptidase [Actinobacteria bacterium]|nr:M50 family metallopeptidase [Actinomycetota bacterium]